MTPRQSELLEQVRSILEREARVEATWLAGSLGRGAGDEVSDVDFLALCTLGTLPEVSQVLASNLRDELQPLLLNVLFGGVVINVVAEGWQRFDVSLIEAKELGRYDANRLTQLFNRSGAEPSGCASSDYRPSAGSLTPIIEEFLRVIGLTPVLVKRGDFVTLVSGTEHLRRLTIDLMLEENRVAPADRGGALSRKALLSSSQYAELEALPPLSAELSSLKANHEAFARMFLERARLLCAEVGVPWPERFEAATRSHLASTVDFRI